MEEVPAKLRTAAMIQLASGLINIFVMSTGMLVAGCFGGGILLTFCSMFMCPCPAGYVLMMAPIVLIPVGILEIVAGAIGLSNPKGAGLVMKIAAVGELLGLLAGGLIGAIAGVVVLMSLRDPEVEAWWAVQREA